MKGHTLEIRRYLPADHPAVMYLHKVALVKVGAYLGEGPWDADLAKIEEVYFNNRGEFLVGFYEDKLVAMGAFWRTGETEAELKRMRVLPEYQGYGFGQQILEELEKRARAEGYSRLHLETSIVQDGAQRFYTRNGYREFQRVVLLDLERILYEKELAR